MRSVRCKNRLDFRPRALETRIYPAKQKFTPPFPVYAHSSCDYEAITAQKPLYNEISPEFKQPHQMLFIYLMQPVLPHAQPARSSSIRIKHPSPQPGVAVKLNTNKFPADFFNKLSSRRPATRLSQQQSHPNFEVKSARRIYGNSHKEDKKKRLPEAQVTSCFKIYHETEETTETTPSRNGGLASETRFAVSDLDESICKDIATSIELNEPRGNTIDFCCTFSKIPVSSLNLQQVAKRRQLVQNNTYQQNTVQNNNSGAGRPERRTSTKMESRVQSLAKNRKNSMQKMTTIKWKSGAQEPESARLPRIAREQFALPELPSKYK